MNGVLIGSKQNNINKTSKKRMQNITDNKTTQDRLINLRAELENVMTDEDRGNITFNAVNPKGTRSTPMQSTQEDEEIDPPK